MTIPNTEKTIYLHMGMPKTGTSSIQYFLYKNKEMLENYGVLYPTLDIMDTAKKISIDYEAHNLHFLFEGSIKTLKEKKILFDKLLLCKLKKTNCKKIILSDEIISMLDYSTIIFFIDMLSNYGFSTKIILYIRPPADWFTSFWYEQMRPYDTHTRMSLTEYCLGGNILYCEHILPLITKLGKDNVIVRAYEKSQWKNQNLLEDFLDIFNIELSDTFEISSKKGRVASGRNTAELSRMISFLRLNNRMYFNDKILQLDVKESKVIETLTDNEILLITSKYVESFKKIAHIYGKNNLFTNELPSCFGKERSSYDRLVLNHDQYSILLEALECNRQEKEEMCKEIVKITHKPYKTQHHVILTNIFNWNDIYDSETDAVSFTFAQQDTLIQALEASRVERSLLWGKLNSLKLSFKEKVYSLWFEDDRIVIYLLGLRIKPSKKICSFQREHYNGVIRFFGFKIKFSNSILW